NWIRWDEFVPSGGGGGNSGNCNIILILLGLCNNGGGGGGASHQAGWNGCIEDRDQNYDTLKTLPPSTSGGNDATRYPAHENVERNDNCNMQKIMPLSDNWTAL